MFVLDEPELRTGVDIAIDGNKLYLTSQSLHCVLVYTISETEPLTRSLPFQLTIYPVSEGIQLKWNDVATDVEGYQVFRSSEPEFAKGQVDNLGSVSGTTFIDHDAAATTFQNSPCQCNSADPDE